MFKFGDEVYSEQYGNGIVVNVDNGTLYPIDVRFEGGKYNRYTVSGSFSRNSQYECIIKRVYTKSNNDMQKEIIELKHKVAKLEADLLNKKILLNARYDNAEQYYIPKQEDFFGIRCVRENDYSYRNSVFVCVASDSEKVIAKMLGRGALTLGKDYKYTFDRKTWHFHRVSNAVVAAL